MKRFWVVGLLTLLTLSACGRSTRLNAEVDLLPLLSEEDKQGEGYLGAGFEIELPDEEGIGAGELGLPSELLDKLDEIELSFSTDLVLSSTTDTIGASLELYFSDSAPVFAAEPIRIEAQLSPDEVQSVDFSLRLSQEENAGLFTLLQSGDFRMGARIATRSDNPDAIGRVSSSLRAFYIRFSADVTSSLSF